VRAGEARFDPLLSRGFKMGTWFAGSKSMDVTIHERLLSFSAEYDINAPGLEMYARKAIFSLTGKIELSRVNGPLVATLEGQFSPIRHRWNFHFDDGRNYSYSCEKVWKGTYVCEGGASESYHLYQHHELLFSIFRNDSQIAAFTKNRVVIGSGNRYDIRMNGDADVSVVVSMILALNTSDGDDKNQNTVTFDLGNVGPEDRKFDESWEPT
jgi:hypothetical protein